MASAPLKALVKAVGGELMEPSKTHKIRFTIYGSKGNPYVVAFRTNYNRWECGCRGWIMHRKCKHLTAMMPSLLMIAGDKTERKQLGEGT